jgi:hypothetical protein
MTTTTHSHKHWTDKGGHFTFDDAFDGEWLPCGPTLEPLPIWTHCGRRIDLEARCMGWGSDTAHP